MPRGVDDRASGGYVPRRFQAAGSKCLAHLNAGGKRNLNNQGHDLAALPAMRSSGFEALRLPEQDATALCSYAQALMFWRS